MQKREKRGESMPTVDLASQGKRGHQSDWPHAHAHQDPKPYRQEESMWGGHQHVRPI